MGYSGQPMISVTNNKNLLGNRTKLFDLALPKLTDAYDSLASPKQEISLYEKDQIIKRRHEVLLRRRKANIIKNIMAVALLILAIATLTNII